MRFLLQRFRTGRFGLLRVAAHAGIAESFAGNLGPQPRSLDLLRSGGVHPGRLSIVLALAALLVYLGEMGVRAEGEASTGPVAEASSGPVVQVGLQGWYKVGQPSEARVRFPRPLSVPSQLWVEALDVDGIPAVFAGRPSAVADGSPTLSAPFTAGRLGGGLELWVTDAEGRELWRQRLVPGQDSTQELHRPLRLDVPVWLTAARLPAPYQPQADRSTSQPVAKTRQPWVLGLAEISEFPSSRLGLQPAQVVVLPTRLSEGVGPSLLEQISESQSEALRQWVRQGGHLVLSLSSAVAWQASPLSSWIPVEVDGDVQVQQFSNLEAFVGKVAPLRTAGRIRVPRLKNLPNVQAPVRDLGGTPLVAVVPCGLGRVSLVMLDIEKAPLADWMGLPVLLEKLTTVGWSAGRTVRDVPTATGQKLSQVGITDLSTQWHAIQERFAEIPRPSYWWVMLLILLTVALVGPVDYLFVNRLFRRGEWTWLTFPLLALAGVALGLQWGRGTNGADLRLNQSDLADVDVTTGVVRGRTWVTLYSPEHQRVSLQVDPLPVLGLSSDQANARNSQLTFVGSPETGLGGLYRETGLSVSGRRYPLGPGAGNFDNLPVLQWSTRTARADWEGVLEKPLALSRLQSSGFNKVQGSLVHTLPGPLHNVLLVVGGWAYFPGNERGTVLPGVPWQPSGSQSQQRDLRALLTGERRTKVERKGQVEGDVVRSSRAYDPTSLDPHELWRMITFHEAVGGDRYTGLSNSLLADLEMTGLVQSGRGVLIGELEQPLSQTVVNQQATPASRQLTLVRLVIPVEQIDRAAPNQLPKFNEPPPASGATPNPDQPKVETP